MQTKRCNKCLQLKDINLFCIKRSSKDNHSGTCKDCEKVKHREYYEANKVKILEKSRDNYAQGLIKPRKLTREQRNELNIRRKCRRKISPELSLFSEAKSRAKRKCLEFSITLDDIFITKLCPILLIPMIVGDGKLTNNSPSLDRFDNSKGYVRGNVMVISHLANTMKNSATKEQLLRFAEYINEFYKESL